MEFKKQTNDHKRKKEKVKPRNRLSPRESELTVTEGRWVRDGLGGVWGLRTVLTAMIDDQVVYASVESLNSTPEINVALCVN